MAVREVPKQKSIRPKPNPNMEGLKRQAERKKTLSMSVVQDTPDAGAQVSWLLTQYAPLAYMLPWEVLDYVELLSAYNPDYSQAVDNIRTLANSGHNLFVEASSDLRSKRIKGRLEEKARTIQEQHGGVDGLIDKLLDQAATYGAMCGEWVVDEDLTDIVDFIDINPKKIRFFWGEEEQAWLPHQKVTMLQAEEAKKNDQVVRNGSYVELNRLTFRYYAFDAAPGSPYGVPPFLAALGNIAIQRDMIGNMAQIVKKIGLLGIIDVVVKQLPILPQESDEQYQQRAGQYLEDYATVIQDMIKDGGIVHYDDAEAKTTQLGGNAAGATNIFKQNEEQIFSGLKSMPSVQGRSYSTTETYAGVAYEIIIRNTHKYQRAVKRVIESGYWLMAQMWGENPEGITVSFNANKTLQRLQEAQSQKQEILNAAMKWALGITDQVDVAQELGYSKPKQPLEAVPIDLIGTLKSMVNAESSQTETTVVKEEEGNE